MTTNTPPESPPIAKQANTIATNISIAFNQPATASPPNNRQASINNRMIINICVTPLLSFVECIILSVLRIVKLGFRGIQEKFSCGDFYD